MIRRGLLILGSLLGLAVLAFLWMARHAFYGSHESIPVKIEKGANAKTIAQVLHKNQVIASPQAFLILAEITGISRNFHYGPYRFEKNRYWGILQKLALGETYKIKVVIPEGWTACQTGERLEGEGIIQNKEIFLQYAIREKLEGKFFPETYFLEPSMEPEAAAEIMRGQYQKVFTTEMAQKAKDLKMTEDQILTLASIIEREARADEDRALISSVYHNRLRKKMLLEADPTVQYALSSGRFWKDRLTYKDLKVISLYNTYRLPGLPPGPICSPGLKSIQAALEPANTSFLYFVADGTGRHQFFSNHKSHIEFQKANRKKLKTR